MAGNTRATAAGIIGGVLRGRSLNQELPRGLERVAPEDRGLLQELCYGSLRQAPRSQALLKALLDKPLKDKDADVQGLLLCGLYQLEHMRIPDHAAVAETVAATRALKKPWAKGLTNAVLRRYLREREQLEKQLDAAAETSHPTWLYQRIQQQWPGDAEAILAANNGRAPMTLRLNTRRQSREDYLAALADQGIEARAGELCPDAVTLARPWDVGELPGFDAGLVSVQDEAAQMAALLLAAEPGERVLDACAAPGGKACHILERQPGLEELVAMDVDPARLEQVSQNLARLQLQATTLCGDAARAPGQLEEKRFDRILVDAPCSASGVIRRHPDVKLLRRHSDLASLATTQLDILKGLWPLLKSGGTLLYATCSIFAEENQAVVQRFLDDHRDASLLPVSRPGGRELAAGWQLLPSVDSHDGLYYALLLKSEAG